MIAAGVNMAIAGWMIWGRSTRAHRTNNRARQEPEICVQFDLSKELKENIHEALSIICQHQGVPGTKKLSYFNAIVNLINENDTPDYGLCAEDLFCCMRVGFVHEATQVRAAALRAVRHMLKTEEDVITINKLHYPYFVARSMDVTLRNEIERMQALRLVRKIIGLAPNHVSPVLARSLISLTNGGIEERDRTFRAFLATVCELGVLNSSLLISCGGVGVLARAAMTDQSPAIIEAVMGVLIRLLSNPETRGSVSLHCLAAPYCELHSFGQERTREGREMRFAASKQALLSVLRSYSGVIHFCHPNDNSGLKAIADILYVEQLEVRGAILELFYELLGLPLPMWTDEPDVALAAVDPSRARENWKLSDGFIASEARSILPSLSSHCPNIMELHLALLVYVLLECGLHRALAETIVSSDTFISVRAAVLLGVLLHRAHSLLPPDVCDLTPPLPNLLEHASAGRHQALAAVAILGRIHSIMRRRPVPASLFLDRILQSGTGLRPTLPRRQRTSSRNWLRRESPTTPLLKDAQVLSSKDTLAWNWPIIRSILRSREDSLRILHDSDHKLFIKRLVRYFKPSSNKYCRVELGGNSREATLAGCDLVNCLLEINEPEGTRLLSDLIGDIAEHINAITTSPSAHDCLFSPRHMGTTCCQKYFLFLGQLSQSAKGTVILKGYNLLKKLQDLAIATNHDCYVKLIISSLDYSREGPNRKVMNTIISEATLENTRLYATQFLRLVLRAKMTDAFQWAMTLLSDRLSDSCKSVALAALDVLHEACYDPEYLEAFFKQAGRTRDWDSWLQDLGDHGYLLKVRMYSLRAGFTALSSPAEELEKWIKSGGFAERYVGLMEGEIHDAMTHRQRGENGSYLRRSTNLVMHPKDVFVAPHLIGQLVQHELGVQLLLRRNVMQRFARIIHRFRLEFGSSEAADLNSKGTRSTRSGIDDSHMMSEESGAEDTGETNRLETIIDAEVMETVEIRTPRKTESLMEMQRKSSLDDSQRTTPERFARDDASSKEKCTSGLEDRILKVKAALWALGHAGTSQPGVQQLSNLGIIEMITSMAECCQHYTVRATAMYALSLISTNRAGADALMNFDWPCVRYKRGDQWPIVPPTNPYPVPSPVPIQRHHRSLSDGKPELPEPVARRTRNRSESAATEMETRRYALPERGETPSPVSSVQRLSQQDAEGYARLRSLQRHRRPSYSHSSLEMYSSDGRNSLLSLSEFESSRSWTTDNALTPTPPPPPPPAEEDASNQQYMGICLPRKLTMIFPDSPRVTPPISLDDNGKVVDIETSNLDDESESDCDGEGEHSRVCLVCYQDGVADSDQSVDEADAQLRREILRHTQRLSNPVWYRHSRQTLLRLRQRYPEKFQDTCLFSEVSARLGSGTYRLPARRFLQELFLDSPFEALYKKPRIILNVPTGTEENPAQPAGPARPADVNRPAGNSLSGKKVNGTLTIAESGPPEQQQAESDSTKAAEEGGDNQQTSKPCLEAQQVTEKKERLSDEKIIAEILKPAERLQISKSSDKLLKVTGTNTAISLD